MKKILSILVGVIVLIVIIGVVVVLVSRPDSQEDSTPPASLSTLEQFSQKTAAEYGIGSFTGYNQISKNGRYIVFGTFDESASGNKNGVLVLDTVTGKTGTYRGAAVGIGNELLFIDNASDVSLVNMRTGESIISGYLFGTNEYSYDAVISPDDRRVAVNTSEKLVIFDGVTGQEIVTLTDGDPRGFEWFSDNDRLLILKRIGAVQMVDGIETSARTAYAYSLKLKDYVGIDISSDVQNPRYLEWVVPDTVVRWNSGYDDGSFDSFVDIKNDTTVDIGETSANLMNGMWVEDGKFYVVGPKPAESQVDFNSYGFYVYDEKGKLLESYDLPEASGEDEYVYYHNPRLVHGSYVFIKNTQKGSVRTSDIIALDPKTKEQRTLLTMTDTITGFTPLQNGILISEGQGVQIVPVP